MAKRFAVIGLGRFGQKLAVSIEERGGEVIAIDRDPGPVDEIKNDVSVAVQLDCTDKSALMAQGVNQVDVAIVAVGENFEANILATMILKDMGVPRILARAAMGLQTRILNALGVHQVIHPEEEVAEKLAEIITFESLIDYLRISSRINVAQVHAPREFWEKSLEQLQIRRKYGVNVVVVRRRDDKEGEELPDAKTIIKEGDVLLLVGHPSNIQKIASL